MSPPEVWGPAVWTLFHTLTEKVHESSYTAVSHGLINMIIRICRFLPCPECSADASIFLAKTRFSDIKTKQQFKTLIYIFHNRVNVKKRRPLFKYSNLNIYNNARIINVANNFINKYHTKGNMKLIAESFQRQLIIKEFKSWFVGNITAFAPVISVPMPIKNEEVLVIEEKLEAVIEENISNENIV